jgi:hypothetical protein
MSEQLAPRHPLAGSGTIQNAENQSQNQSPPMKEKQKHRQVKAVYRLPLVGIEESTQQKSKLERRPHGGSFAPASRLILQ